MKSGRAARERGARAERQVVAVLRAHGIPADRAYGEGRQDDRGDIDGLPEFYVQVRCRTEIRRHAWWKETCEHAKALDVIPVLIFAISRMDPETWIVWWGTALLGVHAAARLDDWAQDLDVDGYARP